MGHIGLLVGWQVPTSGSLPKRIESNTKIPFLLTSTRVNQKSKGSF